MCGIVDGTVKAHLGSLFQKMRTSDQLYLTLLLTVEAVEKYCGNKGVPVKPKVYFAKDPYRSIFSIEKARRMMEFEPDFLIEDFYGNRRWKF